MFGLQLIFGLFVNGMVHSLNVPINSFYFLSRKNKLINDKIIYEIILKVYKYLVQ